jgi:hypothetical protein
MSLKIPILGVARFGEIIIKSNHILQCFRKAKVAFLQGDNFVEKVKLRNIIILL